MKPKIASAKDYWERAFGVRAEAHVRQNTQRTRDLVRLFKTESAFRKILEEAETAVEIGCGTGEMSNALAGEFNLDVVGTDFVWAAIDHASQHFPSVQFTVVDVLRDELGEQVGTRDIAIAVDMLEHFSDPFAIVDNMLRCAEYVIAVTPYEQHELNEHRFEGGGGHIFTFSDDTFGHYNLIDKVVFETPAWQYGENPREIVYLLQQ